MVTVNHIFPKKPFHELFASQPQKDTSGPFYKLLTATSDQVQFISMEGNPLGIVIFTKKNPSLRPSDSLSTKSMYPPLLAGDLDWKSASFPMLGFPGNADDNVQWFADNCYSGMGTPVVDDDGYTVFTLSCDSSNGGSGSPLMTQDGQLAGFLQSGNDFGLVQAVPVAGEFFGQYLAPLLEQAGLNISPN